MNATDGLERDHVLILEGLGALEAVARGAQAGVEVPSEPLDKLFLFFREFADAYHHQKEEQALFPALEEAGLPPQGPVAVMLHEHTIGRNLLRKLREALPRVDADAAFEYIEMLRSHIDKENEVLFQIAKRMLSSADDRKMTEMFAEAEQAMPQVRNVEAYRKLFAELRAAAAPQT